MQGAFRYTVEEEKNYLKQEKLIEQDVNFFFDYKAPPLSTFRKFFEDVIKVNMRMKDGLDKLSNMDRLK
jgi:hypothetical protein